MGRVREFLSTPLGKGVAFGCFGLFLFWAGLVVYRTFGASDAANMSATRTFVCSETGKSFKHTLKIGEKIPVLSPYSGTYTGYPADTTCWWTSDGKIADEPTYVLMNKTVGKKGPTFCPDCGRLVRENADEPKPGDKPPPTKQEYELIHRQGREP